jgi:hypothetical protein
LAHVLQEPEAEQVDTMAAAFEYRNDGYIQLVLKVMARMCDGQNKQLQVSFLLLHGTVDPPGLEEKHHNFRGTHAGSSVHFKSRFKR